MATRSERALRVAVTALLETLDPLEAYVLQRRFALGYKRECTYEELADELFSSYFSRGLEEGAAVAEIARIESRALAKLRNSDVPQTIRDVLKEAAPHEISAEAVPLELAEVAEQVSQLTPELMRHVKANPADLEKLPPHVFENLVGEIFASRGFAEVHLVGRNPHTAADLLVVHRVNSMGVDVRYFVEVKRTSSQVGAEVIDRVYGAMLSERPQFGWHAAIVVSLVGFKSFRKYTRAALSMLGIELREREHLLRWLQDYQQAKSGLWLPNPG